MSGRVASNEWTDGHYQLHRQLVRSGLVGKDTILVDYAVCVVLMDSKSERQHALVVPADQGAHTTMGLLEYAMTQMRKQVTDA